MEIFLASLATFLIVILVIVLLQILGKRRELKRDLSYAKDVLQALWEVEKVILDTLEFEDVVNKVANTILTQLGYLKLGYEIVVLALKEDSLLRRISISRTEGAKKFLDQSPLPFREIVIPMTAIDNLCVKAVLENRIFTTNQVADLLYPALDRDFIEQLQREIGIKASMVYPLSSKGKILGVLIFSMTKDLKEVTEYEKTIIESFVGAVGIAVENSSLFGQLKKATTELSEANEKLKELDKLKDEFVSVASHELRTPMTAIKSYLWMVLAGRGGELTEKQKYYVDRAYISADRLIRLVNNMLNVSRIESGRIEIELEKLDISRLARDVVDEVTPRANELGIRMTCHEQKDLPEVLADPDKIKEVLINLIGNSLKFTPKGGLIEINFNVKNDMVETSVSDTGKGIAKEDMPKLFKKFGLIEGSYASTQQDGGTGLGLYITWNIILLHHGTIKAESEGLGKGATFTFSLPIFKEEDFANTKKKEEGKEAIGLVSVGI